MKKIDWGETLFGLLFYQIFAIPISVVYFIASEFNILITVVVWLLVLGFCYLIESIGCRSDSSDVSDFNY